MTVKMISEDSMLIVFTGLVALTALTALAAFAAADRGGLQNPFTQRLLRLGYNVVVAGLRSDVITIGA